MQELLLRKLIKEKRSITALEFALIGPVLMLFIFGIVLMGVAQFWQLTLDDAVRNASRQISIGAASATTGIHNGADFVTAVCGEFGLAAPACTTALQYSVQGAPNFTGTGGITPTPISASGNLASPALYSGVTIAEPFLVQVVYPVPIGIPLLPASVLTLNGTPSIIAADALVAEP